MTARPLSTAEAAEILKVNPRTIQRWCKTGRLPNAYKLGGKTAQWLIPPEDIDTAKAKRETNSHDN